MNETMNEIEQAEQAAERLGGDETATILDKLTRAWQQSIAIKDWNRLYGESVRSVSAVVDLLGVEYDVAAATLNANSELWYWEGSYGSDDPGVYMFQMTPRNVMREKGIASEQEGCVRVVRT